MALEDIERLRYYPRQFLGSADFQDQQAYHRDMRRRHNLGQHTWGIVSGLELVERPLEGGASADEVEVFVLPGMAVDGFGREIVLLRSYRLAPADFDAFKNQQHRSVWIAYHEEHIRGPAPGYELCDVADQRARVRETFRIVIDPPDPTHDAVIVGGRPAEPPAATLSPPAPPADPTLPALPRDESVPYQQFPADEDRPDWLVRLGSVHWDGAGGRFLKAADGRLNENRRSAGIVAGELLSPSRELRIADRREASPLQAGSPGVTATIEGSLAVSRDQQVGGNVTVKGDLKVLGTLNSIKVATFLKAVKTDKPETDKEEPTRWNQPLTGFAKVDTAFAALQGFSLWPHDEDFTPRPDEHRPDNQAIPQHVFVRVDGFSETNVHGVVHCSESDRKLQRDNTILFTLVVIGRGV